MIAGATADSYGKNVDGLEELAAQADFGISAGNRSDDMDAEILSNHDSTGSDEFKELNLHQLQTEIASLEELERVHLESKSTLRISCLRSGSWRPSLAAISPPGHQMLPMNFFIQVNSNGIPVIAVIVCLHIGLWTARDASNADKASIEVTAIDVEGGLASVLLRKQVLGLPRPAVFCPPPNSAL